MNNLVLTGRVIDLPNPTKHTITIAIYRHEKNPQTGDYDIDNFEITLTSNIYNTAQEYLRVGDLVGVKGHLETTTNYLINEKEIKIICDRLTFLSQAHSANNEEEN